MRGIHLLLFLTLVTIGLSKEEKRKTLIIAVDELNPEESNAVISNLNLDNLEGQSSSPVYRSTGQQYDPNVLQSAPIDKELGYILVTPDDLKRLQNLDNVSVEKPKYLTYPFSSEENYDGARYPISNPSLTLRPGYPPSPVSESGEYYNSPRENKYPERPAPSLSSLSSENSSLTGYSSYDPPSGPHYNSASGPNYNSPSGLNYNSPSGLNYNSPSGLNYNSPSGLNYNSPSGLNYNSPSGRNCNSSNGPNYNSPSEPNYNSPSESKYHAQNGPNYNSPSGSNYNSPSGSNYNSPSGPTYNSPSGPTYNSPSGPNYNSPSGPNYNSPSSNQYGVYSSEDSGRPDGNANSYGSSSYGTKSYPSQGSKYDKTKEQLHSYQNSYLPNKEHTSHTRPLDYSQDKSHDAYYSHSQPSRPMYSGYKPPQTSYDSKYDSGSTYSPGSSPTKYKYYTNPETANDYPVKYSSQEYISPAKSYSDSPESALAKNPHNSYKRPHSESFDSQKHAYDSNSSPISYDSSYRDPSTPTSLKSYGSRTRYTPESLPYTNAHSSKYPSSDLAPEQYPSKETSYISKNTYKDNYDSESHTSKHPSDIPTKYYDKPKSSYNTAPRPSSFNSPTNYYDKPSSYSKAPEPSSYVVPQSPVVSNNYHQPSYRSPSPMTSYDSSKYTKKPTSTIHDDPPKLSSYDPSYDTYGSRKYPVKYKSTTSTDDKDYGSRHNLSKSRSSYRGSSDLDNPVVTRFYETPSQHPEQNPSGYHYKYPESHKQSNLPKSAHYDSSKSPIESSKSYEETLAYSPPLKINPVKESYDHNRGYDSLSKIRDNHSVSKNYKSSRPAPLHDEYEQPRYPPLPVDIKGSHEKSSSEDFGDHSKEKLTDHRNNGNTFHGKSYSTVYSQPSYNSEYSNGKSHSYDSAPNDSSNGHYSDHSSHETDDPVVHTKTITKTYSKPYTDSPVDANYYGEPSSESPYNVPSRNNALASTYDSPSGRVHSYTTGSVPYSKPYSYSSDEFSYSKPLDSKEKKFKFYTQNNNPERSPTYLTETQRPKRVGGVVYRSRKNYPNLPSSRRQKSYLPYKVYDPKSAPAIDYKVYENAPANNFTKPPRKNVIKLKYKPLKKGSLREDFKESPTDDDSHESDRFANIPGEAGKDFPILKSIPRSHFSCDDRAPGFYADVENRCQVYHQCSDKGALQSFLCPNGTIFNQVTFVCEWWHNVDCAKSEQHFARNNDLYKPNLSVGSERTRTDEYPYLSKSNGGHGEYPSSDEYSDHYRGDENVRVNKYSKASPRKRRKNHSEVTYTSSHR